MQPDMKFVNLMLSSCFAPSESCLQVCSSPSEHSMLFMLHMKLPCLLELEGDIKLNFNFQIVWN